MDEVLRGLNMTVRFVIGALALSFSTLACGYIVDGSRVHQPRLLSYAKDRLQNHGTIQQTKQGYTYLKVSDKYISEIIKQINHPGFVAPNYGQNAINGAHISVIYEHEAKDIMSLTELGQTVHFKPLGFYTAVNDDKEYFMLAVEAPELSALRQKYGLPEKLENHAFHITIGVRELVAENELATTLK